MENHVSQQLSAYLTAAALGAASAMCYDLLRTVRLRRRRNRRLTGALDAVYIAVQGSPCASDRESCGSTCLRAWLWGLCCTA